MPSSVAIRPARAGEGDVLGALGFAAWAAGEISTAGGRDVERGHVESQFVGFCTNGHETIVVAELDGRAAGWGAREGRDNYISDLWVAPSAQGRGVGRALLEALETDIGRAGYGTAELETAAVNGAGIRFYERRGYAQVWRKLTFSSGLGKEIEKVRLVKQLGQRQDQRPR